MELLQFIFEQLLFLGENLISIVLLIFTLIICCFSIWKNTEDNTGPECRRRSSIYIPINDLNSLRNRKIVDEVIPYAFKRVLTWFSDKNDDDTYWSVLQQNQCTDIRWMQKNEFRLNENDNLIHDVTFIYELFPRLCKNIKLPGTKNWESLVKNRDSIEYKLKQIKDIRNAIVHQPKAAGISKNIPEEVKQALVELLNSAGKKCNKNDDEIDDAVKTILERISEIKDALTYETDRIKKVKQKLKTYEKVERRNRWLRKRAIFAIPSKTPVNINNNFYPLTLLKIPGRGEPLVEIPCGDLFKKWNDLVGDKQHLFIKGASGSGKSSLLNQIAYDYFVNEHPGVIFNGVKKFAYMIYIDCESCQCKNLSELIGVIYKEIICKINDDDILDIILRSDTLYLIDGLDNINKRSTVIVNELMEHFRKTGKGTFIMTCKITATKRLGFDVNENETLFLRDISNMQEQEAFIRIYAKSMSGDYLEDLVNTFTSLGELRSHFSSPIHLALFCHLFINSPDPVKSWSNEFCVMEEILKLNKKEMTKCIRRLHNKTIVVNKIIEELCNLSLKMFQSDKYCLDSDTYELFCRYCYDNIDKEEDYDNILSCILSQKCTNLWDEWSEYQYFHGSQQEYLASKALANYLRDRNNDNLLTILEDGAEKHIEKDDFKKYLNLLQYVILELNKTNKKVLNNRLQELANFFKEADADFFDWAELIYACQHLPEVVEIAAKVATDALDKYPRDNLSHKQDFIDKTNRSWRIQTSRHMVAASEMLKFSQPPIVSINSQQIKIPKKCLNELLLAVRMHHTKILSLRLGNSYWTCDACDDILASLRGARCRLHVFSGCVASKAAIEILGSLMHYGDVRPVFYIKLRNPLEHNLNQLRGPSYHLELRTEFMRCTTAVPKRPLPKGPDPPLLVIDGCPNDGREDIFALIMALAPTDKRYFKLSIGYCSLSDRDLQQLVTDLSNNGCCTVLNDSDELFSKKTRVADNLCCVCQRSLHKEQGGCVIIFPNKNKVNFCSNESNMTENADCQTTTASGDAVHSVPKIASSSDQTVTAAQDTAITTVRTPTYSNTKVNDYSKYSCEC